MNSAVRVHFRKQAGYCEQLGSPFTALVCRTLGERLTEASAFGARISNWPGDPDADALALRACGALNFQARRGHPALAPFYPPQPEPPGDELWLGLQVAIGDLDAELADFLDSAPQTNEVARSAVLLPGYLEIARLTGLPLSIREIGASAGLNLWFDHYRYAYGDHAWGREDATVRIPCQWRGPVAPPVDVVNVADRRGCDLRPIDAADPAARARMLAYIWPDQRERLARASAALDLAAAQGPHVEASDAAAFVARELEAGAPNTTLTLAHTIFWQYLPATTKAAIEAAIAQAAGRATQESPLAWLRLEAEPGARDAVLRLSLWPDGVIGYKLATASFHGQWMEWLAKIA